MADTRLTLLDFAKSEDRTGKQAQVIELMTQYNPILEHAIAIPADAPEGNTTVYRRRLPSIGTAKINKGVVRSKSAVDKRVDVMGYFAGRSEVDSRIADVRGAAALAARRMSEVSAFTEAFSQLLASTVLYGNIQNDEASFDGLMPRLSTLNRGTSLVTSQVWPMNDSVAVSGSDACSTLIMDWGKEANHLIFPPNTVAGLQVKDHGEISVNDDDGNPFFAYVQTFDQYVGLACKDPRRIARIPNIDLSDALLTAPTQGWLLDMIDNAVDLMPDVGPNRRVMYVPNRLMTAIRRQVYNHTNLHLSVTEFLGKQVPAIRGIPIFPLRAMTVAETVVS